MATNHIYAVRPMRLISPEDSTLSSLGRTGMEITLHVPTFAIDRHCRQ